MYHIIYISTANQQMNQDALLELLEKSRIFNEAHDLTGLLLYKDRNFIQILEGNEACLRSLYQRIQVDPRHHRVITISEGEVPQREFPAWAMGFREIPGSALSSISGFTAYMNLPNQDESPMDQSFRYRELLGMFRGNLESSAN